LAFTKTLVDVVWQDIRNVDLNLTCKFVLAAMYEYTARVSFSDGRDGTEIERGNTEILCVGLVYRSVT
jgi:hypothetical protein